MTPELTTEYNMQNWHEATKDITFFTEEYMEVPNTLYVCDTSQKKSYGQSDFERDLRKVSRKREPFFGENIRDAIKTIKG